MCVSILNQATLRRNLFLFLQFPVKDTKLQPVYWVASCLNVAVETGMLQYRNDTPVTIGSRKGTLLLHYHFRNADNASAQFCHTVFSLLLHEAQKQLGESGDMLLGNLEPFRLFLRLLFRPLPLGLHQESCLWKVSVCACCTSLHQGSKLTHICS